MKKILNNRYPKKITNKSLYRICQEKPLSLQTLSARWSLFGHILRRDKDIPANKALRAYFIPNGNKLRGRPKTNLPIVLNRDLSLIQDPIRLHSSKDLAEITELAQGRKCWRGITSRIEKAAEVSQTKNWDAKRQYVSNSVSLAKHEHCDLLFVLKTVYLAFFFNFVVEMLGINHFLIYWISCCFYKTRTSHVALPSCCLHLFLKWHGIVYKSEITRN